MLAVPQHIRDYQAAADTGAILTIPSTTAGAALMQELQDLTVTPAIHGAPLLLSSLPPVPVMLQGI